MQGSTETWVIPDNATGSEIERIEKVLSVIASGMVRSLRTPSAVRIDTGADAEKRADGSASTLAGPSPSSTMVMIHLDFPRHPTAVTLHHFVAQMSRSGSLTHPIRVKLAVELLRAMSFLHSNGVYHNGLTSDDISVLPEAIGMSEAPCLLVSNIFGASIQSTSTAAYVCSRNYRPPEVIFAAGNSSSSLVDSWVVGCLLFEICTGEAAFSLLSSKENGIVKPLLLKQQIQQIISTIGSLKEEDFPAGMYAQRHQDVLLSMQGEWKGQQRLEAANVEMAPAWSSIIRKCLSFRPESRPSMTDLLNEPLLDVLQESIQSTLEVVPTRKLSDF